MKQLILMLIAVFGSTFLADAQRRNYSTSDLQMIFSFGDVKFNGQSVTSPMRWSPVLNIGTNFHHDFGDGFGIYTGLNIKNIGFIARIQDSLQIHRSYNLGIPVAIKFGNMSGALVYMGYEFELPFNYKFKQWNSSDRSGTKTKFSTWFSDATPTTMHAVFIGFQFYRGTNIKLKYYLNEFLNQNYVREGRRPNAGIEAQVFSISIVSSFLRGFRFYYD